MMFIVLNRIGGTRICINIDNISVIAEHLNGGCAIFTSGEESGWIVEESLDYVMKKLGLRTPLSKTTKKLGL